MLGAVLAAFLLAGCSSTSWASRTESPSFRLPHRVYLWADVSREVEVSDHEGGVAVLVDSLEGELVRRGYAVDEVASAEGSQKFPRIELKVVKWDAGSGAARQFVGFGVGDAHIDVTCLVRLAVNQEPAFQGRISGSLTGGDFGSDPTDAAQAVAREIARAISKSD